MRAQWVKLGLSLVFATLTAASFNIYATYDHHAIAAALGISSQCLSALNQTVDCDQANAARAARSVDSDFWSKENLTDLCTSECSKSLTSWLSAVEKKCARDQVTANGIIFEPKAFPLKYIAGHDIACLRDASEAFCILESQKWDDSVYTNWDVEACHEDDPPAFCMEQVVSSERQSLPVTSLYHREQYCSECFLLLWRQRLLSPTLPPGNFTDYLIDQFKVLEETCSTDLPFTTSAPTLIIGAAPTKAANVRRWAATHIPVASPTPSSLIARKSIAPRKAFYRTATPPKPTQPGTMKACSAYYSVAAGDTCLSIAQRFGIEIDDLMSYNTQLDRDCANLWHNYAICIAPAHIQSSTETAVPTEPGKKNMPEDWDDDDGSNDSDDLPQDDDMPEWLKNISKDGKCDEDTSCVGSGFGDCCSSSGYCGSGPMWCGIGNCVSGLCDFTPGQVSTDGTCGPTFPGNKICVGSKFGDCCSKNGYCGSTQSHCSAENCHSGNCEGEDKDGEDYDEDAYGDKKQSGKHRKDDKDGKGGKRRKRRRA